MFYFKSRAIVLLNEVPGAAAKDSRWKVRKRFSVQRFVIIGTWHAWAGVRARIALTLSLYVSDVWFVEALQSDAIRPEDYKAELSSRFSERAREVMSGQDASQQSIDKQ